VLSFRLAVGRIVRLPESHFGSCKIGPLERGNNWLSERATPIAAGAGWTPIFAGQSDAKNCPASVVDPTEDGSGRADSQRQAKDGESANGGRQTLMVEPGALTVTGVVPIERIGGPHPRVEASGIAPYHARRDCSEPLPLRSPPPRLCDPP